MIIIKARVPTHATAREILRVLLQRVSRAEVRIADRVAGRIDRGFVLLVGFTHTDTETQVAWMAEKVAGLRVFADDEGKMNRALADVGGAVLVVSQFTLYGDAAPKLCGCRAPGHGDSPL